MEKNVTNNFGMAVNGLSFLSSDTYLFSDGNQYVLTKNDDMDFIKKKIYNFENISTGQIRIFNQNELKYLRKI